jgi:hypothetical protein
VILKLDTSFDTATPWLNRLNNAMTGDRTEFHGYVARRASERSRRHVSRLAHYRHETADGLGAKRTGHLTRASQSIEPAADAKAAYLEIPRNFGLHRAFHPIDIVPLNGKEWLTIPATAETYGRRAGEFSGLFFKIVGGRYPALILSRNKREFTVAFWLARSVHQEQDRSLMPSDEEFALDAEAAAIEFIRDLQDDNAGGAS